MVRAFLFVVFFSIGAIALSASILSEDLLRYYHNKRLLKKAQSSLKQLEVLNADYKALLQNLEKDPNFIKRIAPATLGTEPADVNAIYPQPSPEQLAAARKALTADSSPDANESMVPDWITRCSEPRRRIMLFLAGAALVLISFMWFGSAKRPAQEEPET